MLRLSSLSGRCLLTPARSLPLISKGSLLCSPLSSLTAISRKPWSRQFVTSGANDNDISTTTTTATTAPASAANKKPYYVTTPIFYVNAAPHVGHMFNMVLADILKRWQVLRGNDAKLLTGTDEHGLKIQQAAAAAGMTPKALCDQNCETFRSLAQATGISNDYFIRTTDANHADAVRYCWQTLNHRDYIYTEKHEGWYSVSDETFYPQSAVQLTIDPKTGRKMIVSDETGKEVEWQSEENYHFRLSSMRDRLLDFYRRNPDWIKPKVYMDDIVAQVENGLSDLSISRPSERLTWGIRVPDDDSQTIYVWLDALMNYLTYAGYPFTPGRERESIWPADVHVIGKDITRFHCIYWPAFLMALDIEPPRNILVHAHWTMNRTKMSKSAGNVVNPNFALDRFGIDTMRYYFASDAALSQDSDYENQYIVNRYTKGLQRGIGNLASRILRSKRWSVRESVEFAARDALPAPTQVDEQHLAVLRNVSSLARKHMEDELDPRKTIQAIMNVVFETNGYMQTTSPWTLVDVSTQQQQQHTAAAAEGQESSIPNATAVNRIVYQVAESLRIVGILLQPFMPQKAAQLLAMLGVGENIDKRGYNAATLGSDAEYGVAGVDLKKGRKGVLFPPLISEA